MKNLTYLLILTFGFISCKADYEPTIGNADIVGTWNWISTEGGIATNINETLTTLGKNYKLKLNTNYTYLVFEDENEISTGKYELTMRKSIYSSDMERFISYSDSFQQPQYLVLSGIIRVFEVSNLTISDNNYDGLGSRFGKVE